MALKYAVSPRTILLCDFSMGGFRPPEMVKKRPAVVLVGRLPRRDYLHTVVPLSGSPSDERDKYHVRLELDQPLPDPFPQKVWWVKADMIATVGFDRLDLFRTGRDLGGRRKYLTGLKVTPEQFEQIQIAVLHGLGLDKLTVNQ